MKQNKRLICPSCGFSIKVTSDAVKGEPELQYVKCPDCEMKELKRDGN